MLVLSVCVCSRAGQFTRLLQPSSALEVQQEETESGRNSLGCWALLKGLFLEQIGPLLKVA